MKKIDWEQYNIDFRRLDWKDRSICFWWSSLKKERLELVKDMYRNGMPLEKAINKVRNNKQ